MNIKMEKKYLYLIVILILGTIVYVFGATRSGLWYDESVEYFFSKYMTGKVPGSTGDELNMYERICSTYQPPLYNFLMFFWLNIFDSEFGFRLAGILTTLIGSIGIFKAVEEVSDDDIYPNIGALAYIFTSSVAYYGLECAEYNLMLAFASWTTFFFISTLLKPNVMAISSFFVFASLSVYSQYGVVFLIVAMYIVLLFHIVNAKEKSLIKVYIAGTMITGVVAALPLLTFFLIPQMTLQESISVSHVPYFTVNVFVDFIKGMIVCLSTFFKIHTYESMGLLFLGASMVAAIITIIMSIKTKGVLLKLIWVLNITWIMYFIAVACSFYGYNSWADSYGCNNLGGRYALFFIPAVLVALILGIRQFMTYIVSINFYPGIIMKICIIGFMIFCLTEIIMIDVTNWKKDDVREAVSFWYADGAYESKTLLHQWDDAMFNFYLRHNEVYEDSFNKNIETAGMWIRSADEIEMTCKLEQMGYLEMDNFYYVTPVINYSESLQTFLTIVEKKGYGVQYVYFGDSALIHLVK
ncbi:glycosyltransferase family 39 protein [Oribacterium sp. FC2011]|uniref:glycosyltransferase family 39 protein n=1 Tax=Oribacterium sp. FC2011 TaxID=1408311 RepID=UPI0004E19E31|nr:glycosyltransferase family 39 protein [Oribacterium sp. FC2011]